jgi:hypothetical protein
MELRILRLRKDVDKLRRFKKRVLRRIVGPKMGEVTGCWGKLHNEEVTRLLNQERLDGFSM